jgi:transposase
VHATWGGWPAYEKADTALKAERTKKRRASRNQNLDHLPYEEVVIEPESKICPCCNGDLHVIGEDVSKRLDKKPAQMRVIVTRRPRFGCRNCEKNGADEVAGIIQAPAPARLIEGGLPTEAFVADVVVSKHADHLPLYRQSQILARQGVRIERSTLAQWVGAAAAELQPLHDHLLAHLRASPKLFCDETRCPVLDPGRGKTKKGFLWAIARDDRPWAGSDSNTVERSIRGLALTRKNALFAGHDRGAEGWAMIASLLETCKLNAVDPLAWTTDVLTKLVNRWPASRIDELMPWAYAKRG